MRGILISLVVLLGLPAMGWACDRSCAAGTPRDPNGCCLGAKKPPKKKKKKRRKRKPRAAMGREGGACFPNKTCHEALTCKSGVCRGRPQGRDGGKCFANSTCHEGLNCVEGTCRERTVAPSVARSPNASRAGIEWIQIPGGSFQMGSTSGDSDEKPAHSVRVASFELAKSEVTVGQYRVCVDAGSCSEPETGGNFNWGEAGREAHPVNGVSWSQASEFCDWIGARLPSEAEWEYAARSGGRSQRYPWGDEGPTCRHAVMDSGGGGCGRNRTWPVCSKPRGNTAQGVCDMAGNVWEWVEDVYVGYESTPRDGSAYTGAGSLRVARGGGWVGGASGLRAAGRGNLEPGGRNNYLGFRLARSLP